MQSEMTRPIIGIENRTAQEVFDIMCDRFKIALSAADPGTSAEHSGNTGNSFPEMDRSFPEKGEHPGDATPSVAVKALEWERGTTISRSTTITGTYHATFDKHEWQLSFQGVGKTASFNVSRHPNRSAAETAAQTIHEKSLSRYLSAQVQDVAGAETTTRFHIEWIAGARPPVHPNPMTGRTTFESFERAVQHMKSQADDAQFVSLEERRTTIVHIDRSADMRAALPAAPAKQEGGKSNPVHNQSVENGESGEE